MMPSDYLSPYAPEGPLEELEAASTAIVLHWPNSLELDRAFVFPEVLRGEALHHKLDQLLAEQAPPPPVLTEISVFWHTGEGHWELEELESHLYA